MSINLFVRNLAGCAIIIVLREKETFYYKCLPSIGVLWQRPGFSSFPMIIPGAILSWSAAGRKMDLWSAWNTHPGYLAGVWLRVRCPVAAACASGQIRSPAMLWAGIETPDHRLFLRPLWSPPDRCLDGWSKSSPEAGHALLPMQLSTCN